MRAFTVSCNILTSFCLSTSCGLEDMAGREINQASVEGMDEQCSSFMLRVLRRNGTSSSSVVGRPVADRGTK